MKTFKEYIKLDHFEEFSSIQETVTTNNNKIIIKSGSGGVIIEKEKGNVAILVAEGDRSTLFTVGGKDVPALKEFFSKV